MADARKTVADAWETVSIPLKVAWKTLIIF